MLEVKKTEEWAFFFLFLGGNMLIFNALMGFIVHFTQGTLMVFLDGFGYFDFVSVGYGTEWPYILGGILNIIVGILALLAGLKIFVQVFYNFIIKIDVAIVGLIFLILGIGTFSISGLLLIIGGIYCFIYRLTVTGANNPTAK